MLPTSAAVFKTAAYEEATIRKPYLLFPGKKKETYSLVEEREHRSTPACPVKVPFVN